MEKSAIKHDEGGENGQPAYAFCTKTKKIKQLHIM